MKTKVDVRSRSGYNDVGDIQIKYDINQETGKPVKSMRATVLKNDRQIGIVTAESDGRLYVSFDYANDIACIVKKEVITAILADVEDVFNELIEQV